MKKLKSMHLHFIPSEDNEDGELMPIEDDAEWEMIEEMLNTFLAEEDEKTKKSNPYVHGRDGADRSVFSL